jgi:hypothetical protein
MRVGQFKRGGGFLNNVDGIITDYQFTDVFPGDGEKSNKKKGSKDFNALYCILTARVDGADEDVTTTLFAGSADDFEISEDGHVLDPLVDGGALRQGTSFFKFIESLVEKGFPDSNFPEDTIDFTAMLNTRVTFVQVVDEEATKRLGKKKSKDGTKEYNRTDLKVSAVLALPAAEGKKGAAATSAKGSTKGKKQEEPEEEDFTDEATNALVAVVADAGGSIAKSKLSVKIAQKIGLKNPNREAIRALALDDEFLAGVDGLTYDKKKQTLAEAA